MKAIFKITLFAIATFMATSTLAINGSVGDRNGDGYGDDDDDKKKKEKKSNNGTLETKKINAQPDVPGVLVIDLANNIWQNAPEDLKLNPWGSWTVNIYYLYEFDVSQSLSWNMGLGVGLEKYRFDRDFTLGTTADDSQTLSVPLTEAVPRADSYKKTNLAANYFDIPMELRWYMDRNNKRRSLKLALGGKLGFLFDSHTKVKYEENGQTKKLKDKQRFNIKSPRYGVYGRLGFASVSFFYYYGITEFFDSNKGPDNTRVKTMSVGISISGF